MSESTMSVEELFELLRGGREKQACWMCRFWVENRDDERQPRWGTCTRMATQPFPLMFPMSEDPELGAMLITHPKFHCSEYAE